MALLVYCSALLTLIVGYAFGYFLIVRRNPNHESSGASGNDSPKEIDVVIPVRDEADLLYEKLLNLCVQSYPRQMMNIIVVDSSQKPEIQQVAEEMKRKHPDLRITVMKDDERKGKYFSLNKAFRACKSEIVVVTDVDVTTDEDGIKKLVRNFRDYRIGAVSGVEGLPQNRFSEDSAYRDLYNILRLAESNLDSVLMCESNFSAYRRDLIGELPDGTQCDDLALTAAVLSKNYRAIYDSAASFNERQAPTRGSLLTQKLRRGRANIHGLLQIAAARKDNYPRQFRRLILPFEIFIHVAAPVLFFVTAASLLLLAIAPRGIVLAAIAGAIPLTLSVIGASLLNARLSNGHGLVRYLKGGLLLVWAFFEYNMILMIALLLVAFGGPQPSWKRW